MLVRCSSCSAKFNVPDEKIAGKRARMKCKKCGAEIPIDGTALLHGDSVGQAARSMPASGGATRRTATDPTATGAPPSSSRKPQRRPTTSGSISTRWRVAQPSGRSEELTLAQVALTYSRGGFEPGTLVCAPGKDEWLPPYDFAEIMVKATGEGSVERVEQKTLNEETVMLGAEESARLTRQAQPTQTDETPEVPESTFFDEGDVESAMTSFESIISMSPAAGGTAKSAPEPARTSVKKPLFPKPSAPPVPLSGASKPARVGPPAPTVPPVPARHALAPPSPVPGAVAHRSPTSSAPAPATHSSNPPRSVPPPPSWSSPAPGHSAAPPSPSKAPVAPPPPLSMRGGSSSAPPLPHDDSLESLGTEDPTRVMDPDYVSSLNNPRPDPPPLEVNEFDSDTEDPTRVMDSDYASSLRSFAPSVPTSSGPGSSGPGSFGPGSSGPVSSHPGVSPRPALAAPGMLPPAGSSPPQFPSDLGSMPALPTGAGGASPSPFTPSEPTFGTLSRPSKRRHSFFYYLLLFLILLGGVCGGIYLFQPRLFDQGMNLLRDQLGLQRASDHIAKGPPFDEPAAGEVLSQTSQLVEKCREPGGPVGKGRAQVLYQPDGKATSVAVSKPFHQTTVGSCLINLFLTTKVPPFGGQPVIVSKTFEIE